VARLKALIRKLTNGNPAIAEEVAGIDFSDDKVQEDHYHNERKADEDEEAG
jgi:hypothetical protein